MKNILMLGVLGFGLAVSGCMTTHSFFDVPTTAVNNPGYWTGQYDRIVLTLKLNSDGSGFVCEDVLGSARIMSVKKSNDRLYTQDGTYWKISNETINSMKMSYAFGGGYSVKKDDNLKLATPACLEKLK